MRLTIFWRNLMPQLSLDEQETHLNLVASNRRLWEVYSDDPVMQRKLEGIGAKLVRTEPDGLGKHYTLQANQVRLTQKPKPLSEAERVRKAEILQKHRKSASAQAAERAK
jgi:hypothetical protein